MSLQSGEESPSPAAPETRERSGNADPAPAESEGRILVVDDDYSIRRVLHGALLSAGFDVTDASSGEEGLALARVIRYDAVLLDLRMPGKSGIDVCRDLRRQFPRIAILMLSVSDAEPEILASLESGADDYITKPFQMPQLVARLRAAARRAKVPPSEPDVRIRIGEIELRAEQRRVSKSGQTIHLTPKEFEVLHYLMAHSGTPVTHSQILSAVWGPEYVDQMDSLRTLIRQLRLKLEDDASSAKYILTDSHVGYRFSDEETWQLLNGRRVK